jgi:tripartite-type tricarboxylate transporter receptor subunit TctC
MEAGIEVVHVPYAGGAPATIALVAGQADVLFDLVRTRVKSGEVRALAITGQARDPEFPDVPTIAESGFPAVTSTSFTGVVGPAGMPREVVTVLNVRLNDLIRMPEFQARMKSFGLVPRGGAPEDLAAWASAEREKWARVVKASGAKPN